MSRGRYAEVEFQAITGIIQKCLVLMVMTLGIIIKFGKLPAGNSYGQLKLAHTPKKIPKQIFGGIPEFIIVIII